MSDGQKLKDAVVEHNKRQKELRDLLNHLEADAEQHRQDAEDQSYHPN